MPTIGDMYTKDLEVDGAPRHVEIDDTAGQVSRRTGALRARAAPPRHPHSLPTPLAAQEAYADLKKEKMSTGDVSSRLGTGVAWGRGLHTPSPLPPMIPQGYLLVYSITDDTTFSKLDRVRDEIQRAQGGRPVPVFLVGTKADLSSDRAVSEKERLAKARQWGCQSFEVSSKSNTGVTEVFERLVQAVLAVSSDPTKGGGGGSVLGAGRTPQSDTRIYKKKTCLFM
jgi:GTPase SAR1 family protein